MSASTVDTRAANRVYASDTENDAGLDTRHPAQRRRDNERPRSAHENEFHAVARILLPRPVVHCGGRIDDWQSPLHPEEAVYVKDSVKRRIREFTAGRSCARAALEKLGVENNPPLRMGSRRQPLWPAGVVGSISHGAGCCIAAVCTRNHFAGIGVDIEAATPLSSSLMNLVCTPYERDWCESQGSGLSPLLAKFHFSAKEAVFKCLYPVFGEELEFHDVHLDLSLHDECFTAQVSGISLGAEADLIVRGRFACTSQVVMTVATLQDKDFQVLPVGYRYARAFVASTRSCFDMGTS